MGDGLFREGDMVEAGQEAGGYGRRYNADAQEGKEAERDEVKDVVVGRWRIFEELMQLH